MSDPKDTTHPFGGCNNLLSQYQMIGKELLRFESDRGLNAILFFSFFNVGSGFPSEEEANRALRNFTEGVAFVQVEVLESYWDDLLALDVSDEKLSIIRNRAIPTTLLVALLGVLFSLGSGLYVVSKGIHFLVSFTLSCCMALPFVMIWHFGPRYGQARRVAFAKILEKEIVRRRGGKGNEIPAQRNFIRLMGKVPGTY